MSGQLYTAHHTALTAGTKVISVFVLTPVLAGLVGAVLPATGWFPPLGGDDFTFTTAHLSVRTRAYHICQSVHLYCIDGDHTVLFVSDRSAGGSGGHRRVGVSDPFDLTAAVRPTYHYSGGFFISAAAQRLADTLLSPGYRLGPATQSDLVPDEAGWMLVTGLVAKEVPFLILMGLSAASQIDARRLLEGGRSLDTVL